MEAGLVGFLRSREICRRSRPSVCSPRECCFGLAGAFALNRSRIEAICGARWQRRDRSVAANRGLGGVELLKLGGWDLAERFVQAGVVATIRGIRRSRDRGATWC